MSNDLERLALVILNSDREMAGFPPVESRETIPNSDGYVVNALAILTALRNPSDAVVEAVARGIHDARGMCHGEDDEDPFRPITWEDVAGEDYPVEAAYARDLARAAINAFIDAYTGEPK